MALIKMVGRFCVESLGATRLNHISRSCRRARSGSKPVQAVITGPELSVNSATMFACYPRNMFALTSRRTRMTADAEAICEALTRPTMRFVPVKEESQQEVLVLHRVREMLMRQRTQLINGIRGHLTEFGIVGPQRAHRVKILVDVIRDEADSRLPAGARHVLLHLVEQLEQVAEKLSAIDTELVCFARQNETCRRLMTIPGVGVVIATAMIASTRDPGDFKSGRHFAAWLGLVPKQNSTGG